MKQGIINRYGKKWQVYNFPFEHSLFPKKSGAYLIRVKDEELRNWTVIYAGQTKCLNRRMPSHLVIHTVKRRMIQHNRKIKMQLLFHECEWIDRTKLELNMIYKFSPMFNYIVKHYRRGRLFNNNNSFKNKYMWLKFMKPFSITSNRINKYSEPRKLDNVLGVDLLQ